MIRKLANAVGIATLPIGSVSVGAFAAGSSTDSSSKDCSKYEKTTKAYQDCIKMGGKGSGGNTSGGSTHTTPGH